MSLDAAFKVLTALINAYEATYFSGHERHVHALAKAFAAGDKKEFSKHASRVSGSARLNVLGLFDVGGGGGHNDSTTKAIRDKYAAGKHDEAIAMAKAKLFLHVTGPPTEVAVKIADAVATIMTTSWAGVGPALKLLQQGPMPRKGSETVVVITFVFCMCACIHCLTCLLSVVAIAMSS